MKPTVNYFLQSIKDGNTGNFVNAIENMTGEQVESLTKCFEIEMNIEDEKLTTPEEGGWAFMERLELDTLGKSYNWWGDRVIEWAFENLDYDYQTGTNQNIIGQLVNREVLTCQTSLVSHLRGAFPDSFEVSNEYYYEVDGEQYTEEEKDEKLEELREELEELDDKSPVLFDYEDEDYYEWESAKENIEEQIEALENAEMEYCEIYEYWLVSDWLEKKLDEYGECIVEFTETGDTWWGRCTTGQAILLDWVMCQIAYGMEILDFQANSWAK